MKTTRALAVAIFVDGFHAGDMPNILAVSDVICR